MNKREVSHWIGGRSVSSASGEWLESVDPDNGECLAKVARGTPDEVVAAVEAAEAMTTTLAATGPSEREAWLLSAAERLDREADSFREALIREIGSPLAKANMEIGIAARLLRAHAGLARRSGGQTYRSDVPGRWSLGFRKPLGVVAGVTPFNVPLIKGVKAASAALATGNTFVWMPSDQASLIAELVANLFHSAGVPSGAFNVVHGHGPEIGDTLVSHAAVKAVAFTGSQRVGRHVQALCGQHGKRVTLELGGSNPLIVLADADLPSAVQAAIKGGFIYQGQICMSSSRVVVEEPLYEAFVDAFVAASEQLGMGDLSDPTTMIGPIIHEHARQSLTKCIEEASASGARVRCGNAWHGHRLAPTVLTDVTPAMPIVRDEVFGPVVCVQRAADGEDALRLANDVPAMLTASVFTRDLELAMRYAERLQCAMVHVNDMTIQQEPEIPFGGDGAAGFGREGMETAIEDFTKWQWVTLRGGPPGGPRGG
ncbi:MAG: aldehyde dehydrogenase family protein [Planctomycetota bacterium]